MPIHMPRDTAAALGQDAAACESRTLLLERFADPTAKEDARKKIFKRAFDKPVSNAKAISHSFFATSLAGDAVLHAQLQSRLMVNMAGGVMENAGLCLDRFGLPYIPGSAVKGCARRAAIAALREWCASGTKPTGADNPLAPCCDMFDKPPTMLVAIARVFGWCEVDWSNRSDQSDFLWACGPNHREVWQTAAQELADHFGWEIAKNHHETPWKSLPNYAGSVSFLPAYPVDLYKTRKVDGLLLEVPALGKLELDVVTCHHREYYSGKNPAYVNAPDTEEPIPVVFPAVAPGHVFAFGLVPLRGADPKLIEWARTWLKVGLETFGLGAKTAAGYGWFDCSDAVQNTISAIMEEKEQARRAQEAEEARKRAEQERLANAPPHERFHAEYSKLADEPFATQAKKYAEMTDEQRHGFVLALKDRKETTKRWAKKKPELLKPWQEYAQKLQPPIQLP